MHKEELEDLVTEMNKFGPKVLTELPNESLSFKKEVNIHDFELLDEWSGLTLFMDNFLNSHDMSEAGKQRIRARYLRYTGKKDKTVAMNEIRLMMYGASR